LKKVFKINVENKKPDRQIDSIKNEIRKYIKREKKKPLPEDKNFCSFNCKFGQTQEVSKTIDFTDITKSIDEARANEWDSFYMEILREPIFREPKQIEEIQEEDE